MGGVAPSRPRPSLNTHSCLVHPAANSSGVDRRTHSILNMKTESKPLTEADFIGLITRGASRLTPDDVQRLVSELPELRERFARLREAGYPDAEWEFDFLSQVVELVWTEQYRGMPYSAALEAAFAVSYFAREDDLIPDTLGAIGFIDDIAVAHTVLLRNAEAFRAFSTAMKRPAPDAAFATGA